MSLRHALIALLTAQPMTGYEVSKRFGASVGHVWHAPDSQIYPELRRLESEGLLVGEDVPWGSKTKTRYAVTPAGEAAFREWMDSPATRDQPRDAAHLRAAYLEWAKPEKARDYLLAQREFHRERLAVLELTRSALKDRTHPVLAARLAGIPEADHDRTVAFRQYAYDGMIARERSDLRWIEDGLGLLDELGG